MEISQGNLTPGKIGRPATILVVEDSGMNQMLLEVMLHRLNHEVLLAFNGCEALEVLHSSPVDLVLSDINMPKMDGFELLAQIRADQRLKHIPVILMTAGGKYSIIGNAVARDENGFLSHPFSSIELKQILNKFIC
jgi:CheY-like chemotaxis protein